MSCPHRSWEFNNREERECYCSIFGGYPNLCSGKSTQEDIDKCIAARMQVANDKLHGREN